MQMLVYLALFNVRVLSALRGSSTETPVVHALVRYSKGFWTFCTIQPPSSMENYCRYRTLNSVELLKGIV